MTQEHMVEDQRYASRRPDVLVYQTEELPADITVAGPIVPSLQVSTSGTDSDWVVKLIDVYPDNTPDNQPNPMQFRMEGFQESDFQKATQRVCRSNRAGSFVKLYVLK